MAWPTDWQSFAVWYTLSCQSLIGRYMRLKDKTCIIFIIWKFLSFIDYDYRRCDRGNYGYFSSFRVFDCNGNCSVIVIALFYWILCTYPFLSVPFRLFARLFVANFCNMFEICILFRKNMLTWHMACLRSDDVIFRCQKIDDVAILTDLMAFFLASKGEFMFLCDTFIGYIFIKVARLYNKRKLIAAYV